MIPLGAVRKEAALMIRSIRNGLVMAIPVVMTGSFALVLRFFPLPAYQAFLARFGSGILPALLSALNDATLGLLSVYMTVFIGLSRARLEPEESRRTPAFPLVSLAGFTLLSGFPDPKVSFDAMGVQGMFTAIFASSLSTSLFLFWSGERIRRFRLWSDGADADFDDAVSSIFPALLAVGTVALLDLALTQGLHVSGLQELFVSLATSLFAHLGRGLPTLLAFVLASSLLWFLGIHGSNVLEGVSRRLLEPGLATNLALAAQGRPPTEIVSKTFLDVFVLMGGCGSALCLLLALLLFSRNRGSRTLSRIALVPMLFNVNELMIFGLPVVYNVRLLLPFVLMPLLATLTSYGAMTLGLVPLPCREVQWTTPVLIGGYLATGSLAGSALQLLNLVLGVLVYRPFVALHDRERLRNADAHVRSLTEALERSDETRVPVRLTALPGATGLFAKMLLSDLRSALEVGEPELHYQPQYDSGDRCVGAEALLRWRHRALGPICPPLAIRLAEEGGFLYDLERFVLRRAARNVPALREALGHRLKTCVNITASTFYEPDFEPFLRGLMEGESLREGDIWLELTERNALLLDHETEEKGRRIRALGFPLVIDDFGMGHTSIKYLQGNEFDMVKLDGSLVRGLDNPRNGEIITSIVSLARALGFTVLGEYVETREQRLLLEQLGCTHYQGYLYAPALPFGEFLRRVTGESVREKAREGDGAFPGPTPGETAPLDRRAEGR